MADAKEKAPAKDKAPKAEKGAEKRPAGGKGKEKGGAGLALEAAPKSVEGVPRLKTFYDKVVRANLTKQFGLTNPHQVPRLVKIVINVGMGEGAKNPKLVETVAEELAIITGQKAVIRRAKKAIANFGLRHGLPIGASVTLRNARMYEFLDRFISLALPRVRDFRGLPSKSFDGRGNYTLGIKEQMIFPEIDFDKVEKIHGMDITLVTTAGRDDLAMALLREFGWPFRGETPLAGVA
jgi:large subunit ribosomal protein L5